MTYYQVEIEVEVRVHEVDTERLKQLLREHRTMPIQVIAEKLNLTETQVAHYFRTDKYFAIPDADIWLKLKKILGIETDEFDKPIMEFETRGGEYDMRNRIYVGEIAPTLTSQSKGFYYLINGKDSEELHPQN